MTASAPSRCRPLPGLQRAGQRERAPPLVGGQEPVAAGQREPVGVPDGRHPDDRRAQVEVVGHQPDQRQLLVVLLAEVGPPRADQVQQLGDDREHAGEVAGAD